MTIISNSWFYFPFLLTCVTFMSNKAYSESEHQSVFKEAKKCREIGGVWLNDRCIKNIDFKKRNNIGVGGGIIFGSLYGLSIFYDHNIKNAQLHFQTDLTDAELRSEWNTGRSQFSLFVRYINVSNINVGLGLGYGSTSISYEKWLGDFPVTRENKRVAHYKFRTKVIAILGDVGFIGEDGFYVQVGYRPAYKIFGSNNFDESKVKKHQVDLAKRKINASYDMSHLYLGFGWYLGY